MRLYPKALIPCGEGLRNIPEILLRLKLAVACSDWMGVGLSEKQETPQKDLGVLKTSRPIERKTLNRKP